MPPRSKILDLPEDLRAELDQRLINNGFSDFVALSEWLNDELEKRGLALRVGKNSIWRHGDKFADRLDSLKLATEQAKALAAESPDDEGAMSDALIKLTQEKLFNILVNLDTEDVSKINLSNLTKGIAQLTRATVSQKKWMAEVREKAKLAAESIKKKVRDAGMSDEAIELIENEVLQIAK